MDHPALSERRRIEALGSAGLADPSLLPHPEIGLAAARLGGAAESAIAPLSAGADLMDIDFSPDGAIPDYGWLSPQAVAADAAVAAGQPGDQGQARGNEGSWGAEDEAYLEKAIQGAANGNPDNGDQVEYDKIFSQFGQSQEGNCASVAVIKAALDKFKGKIFDEVRKVGPGYEVGLQNGKSVSIDRRELQMAAREADFKGKPSEAKSMAVLSFAVIAKCHAEKGKGSFERALKDLNDGFQPREAAELLGLGHRIREVDPSSAGNKDSVVAWNDKHAVYVDSGKTDSYGQARSFDGTNTTGGRLTHAFTFA